MVGFYNGQVSTWERREKRDATVDDFVDYDDRKIKWTDRLKQALKSGKTADFCRNKVRQSLYRPFTKSNLYFDRLMNERVYVFPSIFPVPETETENQVICVNGLGSNKPFNTLIARHDNGCLDIVLESFNASPFTPTTRTGHTAGRTSPIMRWITSACITATTLSTSGPSSIIPTACSTTRNTAERYQANLRRALPRLPYTPDFRAFARAGQRLAEIHAGYEEQPEYPLESIESPELPLDWRVEKMRWLSKDKTEIRYNDFLTLDGIPPEALDYRLGNRSALEWVIDQYRVTTDTRTGISQRSEPSG